MTKKKDGRGAKPLYSKPLKELPRKRRERQKVWDKNRETVNFTLRILPETRERYKEARGEKGNDDFLNEMLNCLESKKNE